MRRLIVVVLALLVVAGCHKRRHSNWVADDSDDTAPVVSSTVPVGGATGVVVYSTVVANFSEEMESSTVSTSSFTVVDPARQPSRDPSLTTRRAWREFPAFLPFRGRHPVHGQDHDSRHGRLGQRDAGRPRVDLQHGDRRHAAHRGFHHPRPRVTPAWPSTGGHRLLQRSDEFFDGSDVLHGDGTGRDSRVGNRRL